MPTDYRKLCVDLFGTDDVAKLEQIAAELKISPEELAMALESKAEVESLQKVIYQGEGNEISLMDRLREKTDAGEQVLNRLMLEELLESLGEGALL